MVDSPAAVAARRVAFEKEATKNAFRAEAERSAEPDGQLVEVERLAADAALHAATEGHESMETMVRYERFAIASRLRKGPTSATEEEICDQCEDDGLLIRSFEACIWHDCEPCTRLKQLSQRYVTQGRLPWCCSPGSWINS